MIILSTIPRYRRTTFFIQDVWRNAVQGVKPTGYCLLSFLSRTITTTMTTPTMIMMRCNWRWTGDYCQDCLSGWSCWVPTPRPSSRMQQQWRRRRRLCLTHTVRARQKWHYPHLKYQVNGEYFSRELQRLDDAGLDGLILIEAVCIIESTTSSSSSGKGNDDAIMVDNEAAADGGVPSSSSNQQQ